MSSPRFALLAFLIICGPAEGGDAPPALRVLFVGNSLTYANDLPAMVQRLAVLDGRRFETTTVAHANHSLADHLDSPGFERTLRSRWDVVILQQGPSSLDESRRELLRDTRTISGRTKGRLALLMVWPPRDRARFWDRVSDSYRLAAANVGGILIPAGHALRLVTERDATVELVGADGFHPTVNGTFLMALTTYRALAGHLPGGIADIATARRIAGAPLDLTSQDLGLVLEAVEDNF